MTGVTHFVGIGGIGMSAIARILLARGEAVSGSDVSDSALLDELRASGARIAIGHHRRNVNGASQVVVSSAIDPVNPEILRATELGLPVVHRGEMLARLMANRRGIAICGTHGKTTMTAMVDAVLRAGGMDPTLVLGGVSVDTGTNARHGNSPWLLTEADESDGSFALLSPAIAVVANIENDHLTCDADLPQLVAAFEAFLAKLPPDAHAVVGIDNVQSATLAPMPRAAATHTFGLSDSAQLRGSGLHFADLGSRFDVLENGTALGTIELRVPGRHNVENALAAIAVGRALEVPFARLAAGLRSFNGVRRRFEIVARTPRMILVDDYAHHPTAVRATIAAARAYHRGPLIVAFQPHRYTRTAYLADAFALALQDADRVYLAPVYAASEAPIAGVSERSIGEPMREAGRDVRYVAHVDDLCPALLDDAPPGALVLMLGAGDITRVAAELGRTLQDEAA